MIDYTWVSMGAMLRDWYDVKYANKEHQMLCDMADYFYGATISRDPEKESVNLLPEYKALYDQYGAEYFDKVLDDMSAIDSQVTDDRKARELAEDYYDRTGGANFKEDYYRKPAPTVMIDFDPNKTTAKAYKAFKESGLYLFHRGNGDGDPESAYYLSPDKNCQEFWHIGDSYADVTYYFENDWENDSFRKHYGNAANYRKKFGID